MQYCTQNQKSNWTSSQVSQSSSQFVQDAAQTQQSWNTNGIHQYNVPNSRVQQLQSLNVSHNQLDLRRQKTNKNINGVGFSNRSASINNSSLLVSLLRDGILPDTNQGLSNQTQASIINRNTTPVQQVVSVEGQQCGVSSYSQHSGPQQGYYQCSNEGVPRVKSASPAAAALAPHQQWVHPKTYRTESTFPSSAYMQNYSQNSPQGYSTSHLENVVRPNHQLVANSVATQSSVNTQSMYIPTTTLKTNQQNGQLRTRRANSENVNNGLNYYPQSQNLPATVLNKSYNENGIQLQPKPPQTVSLGSVLFFPPQTPSPSNTSIGSARVESGQGQSFHVSPPNNNNMIPERNPVMSSSDGSLPLQVPESVSSQKNSQNELITKIRHWLEEMPKTVAQKPSSQVMPSHANTRAVAVVQPLSQEGGKNRDSLINPEKGCVLPTVVNSCEHQGVDVGLDTEHSIAKESNKAMSNTNNVMANSGLEKQKSVQELQVSNRKSPQCISKEPTSGKKANATPSPVPNADIDSLPITTWTAAALQLLIQETEKSQVIPEDFPSGLPVKLKHMFLDAVKSNVNPGHTFSWSQKMFQIMHFCDQHVSPDTVVLSEVKERFKEKLKHYHYHVLKDEVYSEQPYKSLWLNVSEKLDDIDNEFGFPWALRRHFYIDENDSQKDEESIGDDLCKPAINEVPEKVLSVSIFHPAVEDQTSSVQSPLTPTKEVPEKVLSVSEVVNPAVEDQTSSVQSPLTPTNKVPEKVLSVSEVVNPAVEDQTSSVQPLLTPTKEVPEKVLSVSEVVNPAVEDQTSFVQPPSTPTESSNDSEVEDSSDLNYLFQIEVLSPENAKALYEEVQKDNYSTGGQKEIVERDHMKTDTPNHTVTTSPEQDVKILPVEPIDQICCLGKFMEMNSGLNTPSLKCLCKEKEDKCKSTDKALASDPETVVEDDCEIIILSEELPSKFYQIIDLTDDDKPDPATNQKPKMDHCMPIDSLSDFDMTSSAEEDEPSNECGSLEEIPNFVIKLSESEEESAAEEETSLQTVPPNSSDDCTKEAKPLTLSSPVATLPLLTPGDEDESGQTSSSSEDETRACVEIKNPTDIGPKTSSETISGSCLNNFKLKKNQRSLCTLFPSVKESQALTSEEKSVKLVLFGSANQGKRASSVNKIGHHSSSTMVFSGGQQPPQVLSLNIESSKKNFKEAAHSRKQSLKQLIYEKWSKSFPSCYGHKMKRQKRFSASLSKSQRKNKRLNSSDIRDPKEKGKVSRGRKRTRSLPNAVETKEAKKRRYSVSLAQTAHQDQRNTGNDVDDPIPLKKNIILKFSTLPSSFSFTDGLSAGNEGNNQVSGQSETVNNNQSPGDVVKTIKSNKDLWCPSPDQHSEPPKISKNSNLFEEYQKKYREKTRP
ncbi:hypothetical protein OJAV_G00059790 [Oryzias javanicus]|uniref:Uncharacterized protein n=1 Tax=Oryzias javanicus TaxID=123683 RepID=A0A437DBH3_ORYJA|nr:hypothetical protein OJAV_G00059790 [Oryzias javanicus]